MDTKQDLSIYDNAILSLINIIGSEISLHFDDFLDLLKNDYIFIFIAYILKTSPESLKKLIQKNDTKIEVLSNQINPHNIELIVEYFKTINHEFDIPFDFQDISKIITSIRIFIELFLDLHFLRMKKYQLIYIFLYPTDENVDFSRKNSKFNIHEDELHIYDITNGASILITKSPFKINNGLSFSKLHTILQNAYIPIIICEEMFKDDDYFNMSYFNILVYQIQFILDKVNAIHSNEPKSLESDQSLNDETNAEKEINNDESFLKQQENCKFINGIFVFQSKEKYQHKLKKKWDTEIKLTKSKSCNLNPTTLNEIKYTSKTVIFSKYCIETKKWNLNPEFDNFLNEFEKDEIIIPLILFTNSLNEDLYSISSNLSESKIAPINEICVYAFNGKPFDTFHYPIYLKIFVPQSMQDYPNLQIILTQIYCYLFFITDFQVTILNKIFFSSQIEYLKTVTNICSNLNNDEKNNFHCKEPNIIFLVNDNDDEISDHLIQNNDFFKSIKNEIEIENEIHSINVNNIETYSPFINSLISKKCYSIDEIKDNIKSIEIFSKISGLYVNIRNQKKWKKELKKIINHRIKMVKTDENDIYYISKIRKEMMKFSPSFDFDFNNEFNSILNTLYEDNFDKIRKKLISDLKEFSESNFTDIEEQINQRFYWTDYELQMIEKGYFSSIKKFYSKTIKDDIDDIRVAINIYKKNLDILELQIQQDKVKIQNVFDVFLQKIEQRKETIEKNLLDVSKQGLNYIMKETENIKEIEVIVDINKDLKTVIEQDF